MKKAFAIILALCMVLSLAACGGGKTTPANNSNAAPSNNSANTVPANSGSNTPANSGSNTPADWLIKPTGSLTRGTVTKDGYTNEYFNLSFKVPAGWAAVSDERLIEQFGYSADALGDGFQKAVDSGTVNTYLCINSKTSENIIIACTKNRGISAMTEIDIARALSDAFGKRGDEVVKNEIATVNFMGKKMKVVDYSFKNGSKVTHINQIWLVAETDYAMIVNFTTVGEELPTDLFAAFSKLK